MVILTLKALCITITVADAASANQEQTVQNMQ